jgi:hypothetical protein
MINARTPCKTLNRHRSRIRAGEITQSLLAPEDQGDRLAMRSFDADRHGSIRGERITFESNHAGLRGCHLQDAVIPVGLGLEVLPRVNGGVVLAAGAVVVEKGLGRAFIHEAARDDNDALLIADRHCAGLNHGWPAKSLLVGTSVQAPFSVLWSRAYAGNPKRRDAKTAPAIVVVECVLMLSGTARAAPFKLTFGRGPALTNHHDSIDPGLFQFPIFVPVLSIATVVLMLVGLMLMFGLGFQAGARRNPHDHFVNLAIIGELNR